MNSRLTSYLLSLPERVVRSAAGLSAGLLREITGVALPGWLRRTRLYRNLVDNSLRFLIEQVGQVEGAYSDGSKLADDFALRRAAGNGIELVGILAFRASPVWVMAALADLSGTGRHLIREIADELKRNGLLDPATHFESMDQLLDGLERFGERTADVINTPPLDTAALRRDWQAIRREAVSLPVPAIESVERLWGDLKHEAKAQDRSVFAVSSLLALSALASLPESFVWLSKSASVAAVRTGTLLGDAILSHYAETLTEIRKQGFLWYWVKVYKPYLRAAAEQFSPQRRSLTERLLGR